MADRIWREAQSETLQAAPFKAASQGEAFYRGVQTLKPTNEVQSDLKTRIVQVTTDLAQARFLLFSHLGSAIQVPFLAVLLFWMTIMFAGFALLAPANTTTLAALVVCALSVSGAVFLILELDRPFSGSHGDQERAAPQRPGSNRPLIITSAAESELRSSFRAKKIE